MVEFPSACGLRTTFMIANGKAHHLLHTSVPKKFLIPKRIDIIRNQLSLAVSETMFRDIFAHHISSTSIIRCGHLAPAIGPPSRQTRKWKFGKMMVPFQWCGWFSKFRLFNTFKGVKQALSRSSYAPQNLSPSHISVHSFESALQHWWSSLLFVSPFANNAFYVEHIPKLSVLPEQKGGPTRRVSPFPFGKWMVGSVIGDGFSGLLV